MKHIIDYCKDKLDNSMLTILLRKSNYLQIHKALINGLNLLDYNNLLNYLPHECIIETHNNKIDIGKLYLAYSCLCGGTMYHDEKLAIIDKLREKQLGHDYYKMITGWAMDGYDIYEYMIFYKIVNIDQRDRIHKISNNIKIVSTTSIIRHK